MSNYMQLGKLNVWGQSSRIILGLTIVIGSLYVAISDGMALPYQYIIGSIITLVGVAGWDPLVAMFRRLKEALPGSAKQNALNTQIPV